MTDHVKLIAEAIAGDICDAGYLLTEAKRVLAALAAEGLVIADKEDVLWLRALRAAGVDNWQGIEHAIDLRDEMLAAAGGDDG